MPQQRTKADQQQTCRNNEQKRINDRHVATSNRTGSTTDMSQLSIKADQQQTCDNNKQNRINNRDVETTNKIESTTNMSQQ
jgi:hypothetical protein